MPKAKQQAMFEQGEDLPLFSGTAQTVQDAPFNPQEEANQKRLPGMTLNWSELAPKKRARS